MPEKRKRSGQKKKRSTRDQDKKKENRTLAGITYLFVGLFLGLMGYLIWFQVTKSREIINSPYNVRLDSMSDRVVRGNITDKDGNILAETKTDQEGNETRSYPYGNVYAHVVGYDAMGKSGIESAYNFELLTSNASFFEKIRKELQEEKNMGDTVVTTLDTDLQKTAFRALGNYKGAAVVIETSTGKILSMVSKPTFDPGSVGQDWEWLTEDEDSRLLNRATQGAYAPGSTFKIVTTLAYMRQNSKYVDFTYTCAGKNVSHDVTIHCAGNRSHGQETLADALAYSCNAAFSEIGLQLDKGLYRKTAESLLFNSKLPCDLSYRQSDFQVKAGTDKASLMMTAIGQGDTMTSPYHMALIASAIANGGVLMKPYLVSRIQNYVGSSVKQYKPERYKKLMESDEAAQLKEYMTGVVTYGTATALRTNAYTVAGKTGTAEYSSDKTKSHSWFMGFTNVDDPDIAIAVVIESADQSGKSAVSVAKQIMDAYYR